MIIEGGNVKELEDNVIRLLKNKKLQNKLADGARKLDGTFDWKNVGDKTFEIYKEILNDN